MPLKDVATGAALGAGSSLLVGMALLQRYLRKELKRPELIHAPMEERESEDQHLLQEVRLLLREYWPHPVLEFSGYISTAWSALWAALPPRSAPGDLEFLTLRDGGTVSLHWGEPPARGEDRVVLVLPGLNNSSHTSFVQETMRHLRQAGFQAVALNYRGVGGRPITSPRFGCLDTWQDLPEVIEHIAAKRPTAALFGVGFSMGAAVLLRHLGQEGAAVRLKAAVAFAAPVDVELAAVALESSLRKRCVNLAIVIGLKATMLASVLGSPFADRIDRRAVFLARSLRQMEEATICKLNGYRDADEYYARNSPKAVLDRISVPTLVVNAEDDPVITVKSLPIEEMRRNHSIYLAVTRRGGHIGWGSGGLGAACWTDNMMVDFLQACTIRTRSRL